MEKTFRDILGEFLEEKPVSPEGKAASGPAQNTSFTQSFPREMSFFWQAPQAKAAPKNSPYRSAIRQNIAPFVTVERTPEPVEHLISLARLTETDRNLTQILIQLGATELSEGLSEKRLKKAHRRLAKRLHPDMRRNESASERERSVQMFMNLQRAYEGLSQTLPTYMDQAASRR